MCRTDPRHAAIGAPRDGPGERDRSLLQTFPRTDPAWARSDPNHDQRCQDQQQRGIRDRFHRDGERPADAIIVQPSLPTQRVAELALKHRVPAVSVPRWFAEEGGLMSYSAVYVELFRKAAVYVDKILKGAQPAELPVEQPTHFELVINMRTAKALGVEVPATLLARADELID